MTYQFNPLAGSVVLLLVALGSGVHAETPPEFLSRFEAEAGRPGIAATGEQFFRTIGPERWSCATCHTPNPAGTGKHATTHKPIEPLAPAANKARFTRAERVEKWFRRNCKDVFGRECSAGEKADVMAWLIQIQ